MPRQKKSEAVHRPRSVYDRLVDFLSSKLFFYIILSIFVIEGLWIAFSFRYPMLYDEGYHFNLIKLFAKGYSPIINNQPTSLDMYGDMVHHGSTLFHFLMSFPYRVFAHMTGSMTWQVILLRIVDIILFGLGLHVFARAFRRVGLKQIHVNLATLFFVLLPIVPFVAATINYDNMLFPLTALFLYMGVVIVQAKKPDWQLYLSFLFVGAVALLVKLEFAPIFVVGVLYLLVDQFKRYGWNFFISITRYFSRGLRAGILLIAAALVAIVLLGQGYVRDYADYHTLMPSCEQLLNAERCSKSYINTRDKELRATVNQRPVTSVPRAAKNWLDQMEQYIGLTAANRTVNGGTTYAASLPKAYKTWYAVTVVGFLAMITMWFRWRKLEGATFLAVMFVVYSLAVCAFNLHSYYKEHAFTAVQPRYLLQTMPVLFVLSAYSFDMVLTRVKPLKPILLIGAFLLMLDGAGVVTHIYRSNDSWYWQNPTIIRIDNRIKKIVDPVVVE